MMMKKKSKLIWIDNVKAVAMVLVVLGHFIQSMTLSNMITPSKATVFFNDFIYTFHVPLFFICSGYLYQKYTIANTFKSWKNNVIKKFVALSVPYFTFSLISYALKTLFSSYVHTQAENLLHSLFLSPAAPYWFLYTLFLIFLITPTAKNKKAMACILTGSLLLFAVANILSSKIAIISPIYTTAIYGLWFVIGMCLSAIDIEKLFSPFSILLFLAAVGIAVLNTMYTLPAFLSYLTGFLACFGIIGFIGFLYRKNKQTPVFGLLSKYFMPIFLMHTIFAAGIRAVLFKIGITTPIIHIVIGLAASFAGPILAELILDKIHLDFFVYPLRYLLKKPNKSNLLNEDTQ